MGWDYIVEFEPRRDLSFPFDRQLETKKLLVQVKSTMNSSNFVRGKLSAFKRLVDADIACFIAHLRYKRDRTIETASLLHIAEPQIEQILKRVRLAEKEGRADLHNITINLSVRDSEQIDFATKNLREIIERKIGLCSSSYIAEKAIFRNRCGYDAGSLTASFSLFNPDDEERLVDMTLGSIESVCVDNLVIKRSRFGISLANDVDHIDKATISATVEPVKDVMILAKSRDTSRKAWMKASIYFPGIPDLPDRLQKVRISNDILEYTVNLHTKTTSYVTKFNNGAPMPINTLAAGMNFTYLLSEKGATIEAFFLESRTPIMSGHCEDSTVPKNWQSALDLAQILASAANKHMPGIECNLTLQELFYTLSNFQVMLLALRKSGYTLNFTLNESRLQLPSNTGMIIWPIWIEFGSFVYSAIVRSPIDTVSFEHENLFVTSSDPHIIDDGLDYHSTFDVNELNRRSLDFAREYATAGCYAVSISTNGTQPKAAILTS